MTEVPVLLLKTPSSPIDRYHEYLTSLSTPSTIYKPIFLTPLTHTPVASAITYFQSLLRANAFGQSSSSLLSPAAEAQRYGALVITSQRAVETIAASLEGQHGLQQRFQDLCLPVYVVGPATANVARTVFGNEAAILGEDCGNGDALADYILHDYRQNRPVTAHLPLLFLAGVKRRNVIPRRLQSEGIQIEELAVYQTFDHTRFDVVIQEAAQAWFGRELWVVFFSASNADAVQSALHLPAENVRIATIGPTTRDYLVQEHNITPEVCAAKPTPECLGNDIHHFRSCVEHTVGETRKRA